MRQLRYCACFLGRTVDKPNLARAHAETGRPIRSLLATAVHNGKECGEVPDDTDPALAALELHSLLEGLALQLGSDPGAATSRTAFDLVTTRVQAVFPGRCRRYELVRRRAVRPASSGSRRRAWVCIEP